MAMAATAPTITLSCRSRSGTPPLPTPSSSYPLHPAFSPTKKPPIPFSVNLKQTTRIRVANSEDNPTETAAPPPPASEDGDTEESSIESPESLPSLISTLNVERALRGIAITDVDHYGSLGLPRKCPYDQVLVAYNKKVEELKNQGLDEDELEKKLELLKESYTILSSVEERRLYDWSLARSEKPDRYVWPFESDITQTPTQSPPPQEPEDVGPTRLVGYFMLGWLVLSVVLSIALNR